MGLEKKIKKAFHRKTSSSNPLSTKEQIFQLQSLSSLLPHFLMISKMSLFIFQITLFIYPWVECRLSIKFRFSADQRILVNSAHLKKCGFSKFPHVRAISGKPYFSSRISLANKKHVSPCQEARIKTHNWIKPQNWVQKSISFVWFQSVPKKSLDLGMVWKVVKCQVAQWPQSVLTV